MIGFKSNVFCRGAAMVLLLLCVPLWGYPAEVCREDITVKGKVTDVAGEPLAGVTVVVEIKVPENAVLEFALVGMEKRSVPVNGKAVVDVVLQDENVVLDELVVVGFGSQRKENLTGAVSTVNVSRTMEGKPFTDPAKGLQGVVPGLTVTFSNGAINKAPAINIRGMGSLNATDGGSPLILVDNVVVDDISLVNSDEIESISVLKDAASTSIYGARAAFARRIPCGRKCVQPVFYGAFVCTAAA